jgi:hypothetical protein
MKLLFTEQEFSRLSNVFDRLMQQRAKLPESEWKKDNNKLIKQLAGKFAPQTMPTKAHEVHLDRKQLRFIEGSMQISIDTLEQKVLPEYEKRGDGVEHYKTNIGAMLDLYKGILAKVEASL